MCVYVVLSRQGRVCFMGVTECSCVCVCVFMRERARAIAQHILSLTSSSSPDRKPEMHIFVNVSFALIT